MGVPERKPNRLVERLKAAGRAIVDDPGVQAGVAQIVASLCALAIRSVGPRANRTDTK